jgi:hypothetical protein
MNINLENLILMGIFILLNLDNLYRKLVKNQERFSVKTKRLLIKIAILHSIILSG